MKGNRKAAVAVGLFATSFFSSVVLRGLMIESEEHPIWWPRHVDGVEQMLNLGEEHPPERSFYFESRNVFSVATSGSLTGTADLIIRVDGENGVF